MKKCLKYPWHGRYEYLRVWKAGHTKCLKERGSETFPVSRVGWRFSSAMHEAGEKVWGRKYYPTLTHKNPIMDKWQRAYLSFALIKR